MSQGKIKLLSTADVAKMLGWTSKRVRETKGWLGTVFTKVGGRWRTTEFRVLTALGELAHSIQRGDDEDE